MFVIIYIVFVLLCASFNNSHKTAITSKSIEVKRDLEMEKNYYILHPIDVDMEKKEYTKHTTM